MARKDQYAGLTDIAERVIAACTAEVVAAVDHLLQVMGPRPFGYTHASTQQQLEQWLAICDDPMYWATWFEQHIPLVGAEAASSFAVRESTRMVNLLADRGKWNGDPMDLARAVSDGALSVRQAALMQQLGTAQQAADAAEEIASKPPITVLPPLLVPDELMLMGAA